MIFMSLYMLVSFPYQTLFGLFATLNKLFLAYLQKMHAMHYAVQISSKVADEKN